MKTTERFENAVTKLYKAFHENKLDAMSCSACAVGNICDNQREWIDVRATGVLGQLEDGYTTSTKALGLIYKTGYSPNEIVTIEAIFLNNTLGYPKDGYTYGFGEQTKENQFKGLCAVVEYLCELDGIPNVMDYSKLFETENDQPVHELKTVFK